MWSRLGSEPLPIFGKKPAGVDGLIELCRISPALQTPTVRLLSELAMGQLGPWAAAGWDNVLTDSDAKREFQALKREWAKLDENMPLRLAAGDKRAGRRKGD